MKALLMTSAMASMAVTPLHAAQLPGAEPREWPAGPEHHTILIERDDADERNRKLLVAAEAWEPEQESLKQAIAADGKEAEPQAGQWWHKEVLGIRIPFAITGEAIRYYTALVEEHRTKTWVRYAQPASSFSYQANITHHEKLSSDGRDFTNVTVVAMNMKFHQRFTASQTEGFGFEKMRVVIFDKDGKILHVAGDGPVDVPIFAM